MFTINIYLKFALIAIGIIGGIILTTTYGFWYGFPFLLIGIILLVSYFLLGTVQTAGQLVEKGDFQAAKQRLGLTFFPRLLYVTNRAMFYIMHGSIEANTGNNKEAEGYFNKALGLNLPSDNERAMVYLQLANMSATKNNWSAAKNYFSQAKKLNITMSQIKDQMFMLEKALKQSGQAKLAQSMGKKGMNMAGRSSKRRRPRMR